MSEARGRLSTPGRSPVEKAKILSPQNAAIREFAAQEQAWLVHHEPARFDITARPAMSVPPLADGANVLRGPLSHRLEVRRPYNCVDEVAVAVGEADADRVLLGNPHQRQVAVSFRVFQPGSNLDFPGTPINNRHETRPLAEPRLLTRMQLNGEHGAFARGAAGATPALEHSNKAGSSRHCEGRQFKWSGVIAMHSARFHHAGACATRRPSTSARWRSASARSSAASAPASSRISSHSSGNATVGGRCRDISGH